MTASSEWAELVEGLRPHLSPEWVRHAAEHGGQSWIRLILLVDAHNQLSSPGVAEKVAMTMADLAVGHEREREREGWEEMRRTAEDKRIALVAGLVDSSEGLLPDDLRPLFARSIEPSPPGM